MWVSSGMISFEGLTPDHPPGSTASARTIHRRKRFSLLQALPLAGMGRRLFREPVMCDLISSVKEVIAGRTVSPDGS